jgi:folate-binding protein YgfZ
LANRYVILESRAIVTVAGADARGFLQGLISQDIEAVTPERAAYGAFLTPQGKYLHDFCLIDLDGAILLDCEAARADDLATRLSRYRLRAAVTVIVEPAFAVAAIFGDGCIHGLADTPGAARALTGGVLFVDPRHAALGWRAFLPRTGATTTLEAAGFTAGELADYEARRIALTIPDGSRDLDIDRTILLEANFDTLHGIAWDKGCYLGQELTARTKYRGLVKRRLVTVTFDGPAPAPGTPIEQNGREVGILRSGTDGQALASLRVDALDDDRRAELRAGDRVVAPA